MTSELIIACQYGSLDALAIIVERQCESIETFLLAKSVSCQWHNAQLPEPLKSSVEKVTKEVGSVVVVDAVGVGMSLLA